jgi:hypothetical protein
MGATFTRALGVRPLPARYARPMSDAIKRAVASLAGAWGERDPAQIGPEALDACECDPSGTVRSRFTLAGTALAPAEGQ